MILKKGPQGQVCPHPGAIYHNNQRSFSLKLLGQSKPNVFEGRMKLYINGQGHMTKMVAMAINSKKPLKIFFFRTRRPEASMNTALQSLYKSLPRDDLDLFYGKVSLGCISQFSGERLQDHWSSCILNFCKQIYMYSVKMLSAFQRFKLLFSM